MGEYTYGKKINYIFVYNFFVLIFAEVNKGSFSIGGLRIENTNNENIFLDEESYMINEGDLFHCIYKIYNKGKSDTINFLLNIITENKEEGVNFSETLIPEDFNIVPEYEGIPYDLVVDGKIMSKNLKKIGRDERWLRREVEKFKIKPEEALVVTFDGKGQIFCQEKERKKG